MFWLVLLMLSAVSCAPNGFGPAITSGGTCYLPVDIVLLLDSSGSLGIDNWRKELDFASIFVENFEVSANKTHVGIIDFSIDAIEHLSILDPNQGLENVKKVLNDLKQEKYYQNGLTKTDLGLAKAKEMFEAAKNVPGRNVSQILIVVTDGMTTWRGTQTGLQLILPLVMQLDSLSVRTYAISVGHFVNEKELHALASIPSRVFQHNDFDELIRDVKRIAEVACPVETNPTPVPIVLQGCDTRYRKIGCYIDNQELPRPLENYALNARDPTLSNYIGVSIDWKNWEKFLTEFVCRCAVEANRLNHKYFGIQFFGECWTSASNTYMRDGTSELGGCVDTSFRPCNETQELCAGMSHRNEVYSVE